ncbi:hypothetical protein [Taibaiella chishuiensis]|uniref:Uncharacterized protein n=1 Tax=Taibaiella chishuiensis TaxID=1434707 RepID=A0A2P8DDN4_9BACT|nr:hypothetical protein [Taibaiella chishuiensis]PSK95287.1 hypothetical protein B0I18_1011453 [Taibaiella chishuiensis]
MGTLKFLFLVFVLSFVSGLFYTEPEQQVLPKQEQDKNEQKTKPGPDWETLKACIRQSSLFF